jgi:hypothetical protein
MVRKEDPGSKQKSVFATTRVDDPREDAKVVVGQRTPCAKHIAGDEEIPVRNHQPAQARHASRVPRLSGIRKADKA